MRITDILDRLENEICMNYCKYEEQAEKEYEEGVETPSVCENCPILLI